MWRSVFIYLLIAAPAYAQVTGDLNTNVVDSTMDSNNVSYNYNATGAGSAAPVMSAIAPTVMGGGGNESCLVPTSNGISLSIVGMSSGTMEQDPFCNRRRDARLLGSPQQIGGLGLQVSAISRLCVDNPEVQKAMVLAATPCPVLDIQTGKIAMGPAALEIMRRQPDVYIVNYAQDRVWWDQVLMIGQEIERVQETTPTDSRSLSERFRRSIRDRRPTDSEPDQ